MSLSRRLSLMLGALLLLSLLGAAATHVLLGRAGADFSRSQGAADRLSRVLQLEIDLTSARNQINIWLQRANPAQVRAADDFLARLDSGATGLGQEAGLSEAQRAQLTAFQAARVGYLNSWRQMQEIVAARVAAETEMMRAGDGLFRGLGALSSEEAQAVERPAMAARVAALRYRLEPQTEQRDAALRAGEAAALALRRAGITATSPVGVSFQDWLAATQAIINQSQRFAEVLVDFRAQGNAMSAAIAELRRLEGAAAQSAQAEAAAGLASTEWVALLASALVILGGIACIIALIRAIVPPLRGINAAMGQVAGGDFEAAIPFLQRKDELGSMARALEVFRNGLAETAALRAAAERDRADAEAARRAALTEMAERVEREAGSAVEEVRARAGGMSDTAEAMAGHMREAARASEVATQAAGRSLDNAQAVAAATEELSASVREISERLAGANALTRQLAERGDASRAVIAGLSEGVGRIGEVVRMISEIAGRTNLLALNATIESARAGEAGKGFAVVASEVKDLAAQTARATEEVGKQVQEIGQATEGAVRAVAEMAGSVGEIDRMATSIAAAVEQQAAATREIAARVSDAAEDVRAVSESLGQLTRTTVDTAARTEAMQDSARQTRESVEGFRGSLVRIVRSATG
ncbi:HAMP domain-containing protein [Roseococcus sp. SDR]|uniref:methyl-accepting chemotaxis protein n=1 Tax=Roseococcus sp. SDR TaxID=2835532 RepID=UPI001BD00A55|nr:HAMP domain-containing methyl-accepting chemotaxis protein [Roseococcus sp. SDR]MBS7791146.1 HAMP domain-containing protein [Roseococcus sp. SDR]MBV1846460.1 HAMP domain-containing protein [Roseococcus sp. SDR]